MNRHFPLEKHLQTSTLSPLRGCDARTVLTSRYARSFARYLLSICCGSETNEDPSMVGLSFWPSPQGRVQPGSHPLGLGGHWGGLSQAPPRFDEGELIWLSGRLSCCIRLVPHHLQAFWGLELTGACREEPFLPANERERESHCDLLVKKLDSSAVSLNR